MIFEFPSDVGKKSRLDNIKKKHQTWRKNTVRKCSHETHFTAQFLWKTLRKKHKYTLYAEIKLSNLKIWKCIYIRIIYADYILVYCTTYKPQIVYIKTVKPLQTCLKTKNTNHNSCLLLLKPITKCSLGHTFLFYVLQDFVLKIAYGSSKKI